MEPVPTSATVGVDIWLFISTGLPLVGLLQGTIKGGRRNLFGSLLQSLMNSFPQDLGLGFRLLFPMIRDPCPLIIRETLTIA